MYNEGREFRMKVVGYRFIVIFKQCPCYCIGVYLIFLFIEPTRRRVTMRIPISTSCNAKVIERIGIITFAHVEA